MAVVATGSIADRPFGRTVAAVAQRRFTGTLQVGLAGIGWREGLVVSATGTHPADGAIKTALGAGLVSSSQVSEILRVLKPGADDIAAVVDHAKLSADQAAKLRRRVVANRAMRLFAIPTGDFVLDDTLAPAAEIVPIDVRIIIYHGVRAHFEDDRVLRELATLGEAFRLRVTVEEASETFGFGEAEQAALAALASRPYTPTSLVQATPLAEGRVTLAALYTLVAVGYAEPTGRPSTVPPPRTRAASSIPAVRTKPPSSSPPPRSRSASSIQAIRARVASQAPPAAVVAQSADLIRTLVTERLALLDRHANFFELLGVTNETTQDGIRAAYFELARQLHPDRITATGLDEIRIDAQRLFAQINAAFGVLSNVKRRDDYMKTLAAGGEHVVRKKQEEAEALAKRLLEAEHEFRTGEMALRRNNLDIAIAAFRKAVELNPEEGEHHALLAWASWCTALDKDKVEAAKHARIGLEKGAKLSPKSPVPHMLLGKLARSLGDDHAAARHFHQALEIAPGHGEAESELRVIEARHPHGTPPTDKKGLFGRFKR